MIQLQLTIPLLGGGGAANVTFDVETIGAATRYTLSGEGFGAAVSAPVLRNGGVFEVQLDADPQYIWWCRFKTTHLKCTSR